MSDITIAVVTTVAGLILTVSSMGNAKSKWGALLAFIVGLYLTVMALATIAGGQEIAALKYRTNYWFEQFLLADSARVECEMAQPIIFPRDTAEIQL